MQNRWAFKWLQVWHSSGETASSAGIRRQAKRETLVVSYSLHSFSIDYDTLVSNPFCDSIKAVSDKMWWMVEQWLYWSGQKTCKFCSAITLWFLLLCKHSYIKILHQISGQAGQSKMWYPRQQATSLATFFLNGACLNIMPVTNISKSIKWRAWNICCNRMSKIKLHLKQISKLQRCHVLKSMTDVTRPMSSKRFHATWSNCSTWLLSSTNFTGPRKQASTQTNLIKTLRLTFFIYW